MHNADNLERARSILDDADADDLDGMVLGVMSDDGPEVMLDAPAGKEGIDVQMILLAAYMEGIAGALDSDIQTVANTALSVRQQLDDQGAISVGVDRSG